ncbi:unnamed protein product [Lampetra planeri]
MKIPLWCLVVLLACLFTPGRSDCPEECVACGLLLQQQQLDQAFNTMVCLLECEGHVSSSLTWEVCKRTVKISTHPMFTDGGALLKRVGEQLEMTFPDVTSDRGPLSAESAQEADPLEQQRVPYDSSLLDSSEEEQEPPQKLREERNVGSAAAAQLEGDGDESSESVSLSKRFGGFQRGRHGYRKLIGSPMIRPLQKRYGGFIGVRKSARKWNSQKRVNQLLRQYLGMRSSRSGRFNNSPRVWRQNKL